MASKYGLSSNGQHGWDHAAMVHIDRRSNLPMLLEGDSSGVTMRTFEERLMQGTDHQEMIVLPLRGAQGPAAAAETLGSFVKVAALCARRCDR